MLDPIVVAETLKKKPETLRVILTGRNAHSAIVALAFQGIDDLMS